MALTDADFDFYTRLLIDDGRIRGRDAITQLVAIGAAESGLDNLAVGDNAKNNTPRGTFIPNLVDPHTNGPIDVHFSLGLGWLQHDSGWMRADALVNGVGFTIEAIRQDPAYSIDLLVRRPGFVLLQGLERTYINFKAWATWPEKSDPFLPMAEDAYDRVAAA